MRVVLSYRGTARALLGKWKPWSIVGIEKSLHMTMAHVAFMRSSAVVAQGDCGMRIREAFCDERSARLQGKCAEIVETPEHWTTL